MVAESSESDGGARPFDATRPFPRRARWRARFHDAIKAARFARGAAIAVVKLSLFTDHHGQGAIFIGRSPRIVNRGFIQIGRRLRVRGQIQRCLIETGPAGSLVIGDDVFINQGTCIFAERSVRIGSRVDIGDAVRIYDTNFHPTRPGDQTRTEPVVIEDDVWLASGCLILPGVTVGRGSVVGAGAIVTKSVAPGSLVVGSKSRTIELFDVPAGYRRRGR